MRIITILLIVCSFVAQAQEATPTYEAKLKSLMELNGSKETFEMAVKAIIESMKSFKSEVPDKYWNSIEDEFLKTSLDDLVVLLAPVYAKHIPEADLDNIITFYGTPSGKLLAASTPAITKDSMEAGQKWGEKIGADLMKKLQEEGY